MNVRDNIHGNIEFSDEEWKFISHPYFQRLRNIKQLAFAEYEFPGATHTRFTHSMGVCKCVTDMYNSVCRNSPNFYRAGDLELLRYMALAHDLCHSPFSHASEELSNYTHEERLTQALEVMGSVIDFPNYYNIPNWELVDQVYQGYGTAYMRDRHLMVLHSFLDGFIDADKLDYLERDAFHCGVKYGHFDRIDLINNLIVVEDNLGILSGGIASLENFILARYYMFSEVYMNAEERILRMLYCEEMKRILKDGRFPDDIKKYMQLDDTKYVNRLKCLRNKDYVLILDTNFNMELKATIERLLGSRVICDCPRKSLFRSSDADTTVMVLDENMNILMPCTDLSVVLKGLEFSSVHKLRCYTHRNIAEDVKSELGKVVKRFNDGY